MACSIPKTLTHHDLRLTTIQQTPDIPPVGLTCLCCRLEFGRERLVLPVQRRVPQLGTHQLRMPHAARPHHVLTVKLQLSGEAGARVSSRYSTATQVAYGQAPVVVGGCGYKWAGVGAVVSSIIKR